MQREVSAVLYERRLLNTARCNPAMVNSRVWDCDGSANRWTIYGECKQAAKDSSGAEKLEWADHVGQ